MVVVRSICRYLARRTRQRLAATTLQCWKRCIWLDCWFAQQDIQHQKRLRLQSLCRGASAYAMSVRGDRRPPPTPTNKPFDPKVLHHPFRDRGLPLPQRRRSQQNNCPRRRPGRRNRPRAPDSRGGLLCMPLCFWVYTDCGGSIGSFCWGSQVKIYTLPHTPLRCLTYPTGLPVLRPSGLTAQQSHRPYDIRSRYPPHTAQSLPF